MFYTGGAKHILSYQHSYKKYDARIAFTPISYVCCAKHAKARGFGGMPPRKFLKLACSEIDFGGILYKK